MFTSARIKLTLWYVVILMVISLFFSFAFYKASTIEVTRILNRIEMDEQRQESGFMMRRNRPIDFPSIEELETIKQRLRFSLVILNGIILCTGGGASYFLAGKTLKPIQQMVEEQQQFISNASHELRTPIATLRAEMESQLLMKKITDKQTRHLIKSNLEEVGSLQQLSNELLTLIKLHGVHDQLHFDAVAAEKVVEESVKKIRSLAKKKEITIIVETDSGVIPGDYRSLTQVFQSLLDNAIKYSDPKTTITVLGKKQAHRYVVAMVDQGFGISPKDLSHIFDRFYRAQTSRVEDGFGLGLSIAKTIIEKHSGSISVLSEVGKGSTFTVSLPLA